MYRNIRFLNHLADKMSVDCDKLCMYNFIPRAYTKRATQRHTLHNKKQKLKVNQSR